ncbi:MAG: AAA family ATPase [Clostridiales bacterium]|nr:AAA family ATPase [Clostridiales bacterium]
MENINILNETFNLYYNKAKECIGKGDKALAKRYYMLAAEQMLKMAKASKGELQKARYARAKSILECAESISAPKKQTSSEENNDGVGVSIQPAEKISVEEALARLDALVGLSSVKSKVRDWVDQIKVFQMRKARGMSVPDMSYHLVFTGNPGTGKTTVARLMAQIYCALGIISEGHLVEVDRSELVAGYVGQTAIKTRDILKKAYGGILFIDEAYTLAKDRSNDFGQEAIDTILKEMEDKRENLVVIVAGYDGLMSTFIDSNPGLRSRFKNYIKFDDYTGSELAEIFFLQCAKSQYTITPIARQMMCEYFENLYANRNKNFGNGRDVRNAFENIITEQSRRVARMANPSNEEMATIDVQDVAYICGGPRSTYAPPVGGPSTGGGNPTPPTSPTSPPPSPPPPAAPEEDPPENKILEGNDAFNSEFKFDWDSLPIITFDDIAGLDSVKDVVRVKVLLPLQHPDVFEGYVRKGGGGLLLYGPPGTGKTMIAAAIANEIGAKFCSVKPSDLLNQGVGNTEKAVRALFAQARSFPCAVIYFDEMDSISPKSTKSQYAKQLRSELLSQLQGIESYGKETNNILFLIAATNKPWDVDSAFIRPGRFGTRIYVGLPNSAARQYLVEHRLEKLSKKGVVKVEDDVDLDVIVERTNGFNGSDMSNLLDRVEEISALRGIKTGEKCIKHEDFETALEQITSSVQKEDIERLLAWNGENQ